MTAPESYEYTFNYGYVAPSPGPPLKDNTNRNVFIALGVGLVLLLVVVIAILALKPAPPQVAPAPVAVPTSSSAAPVAPPTPAPPPLSDSTDSVFLDVAHGQGLNRYGSDAQLIGLGREACDALRADVSLERVLEIIMGASWSEYDARYFVALAVGTYCIDQGGKLK